MNGIMKRITVLLTVLALVVVPCMSCLAAEFGQGDDIMAGKMTADALVVRPLAFVATAVGAVVFVVSLPFSALGGNVGEAHGYLVENPFKFTFSRPLGDF